MLMATPRKKRPAKPHPKSPWPDRLRKLRADLARAEGETKPITQQEAARRLGVPARTWIGWENCYRQPQLATILLLNTTFGTKFPTDE